MCVFRPPRAFPVIWDSRECGRGWGGSRGRRGHPSATKVARPKTSLLVVVVVTVVVAVAVVVVVANVVDTIVVAVDLGGVVPGNLDVGASIEEFGVVPPLHDEHVRDLSDGLRTPGVVAAGGPTGSIFV